MLIPILVDYFVFSFFFNFDFTRPDGLAGQTVLAWRVCDELFSQLMIMSKIVSVTSSFHH